MSGPLSKFIHKTGEGFIDTTGLVDDGSKPLPKIPIKACPPATVVLPAPNLLEVKAWQVDRLNQEIEHQESLIRECTVEITALTRQKEKALLGLDKADYSAILAHVEKIKKAREGRTKPPELLELDDDL